MKSFEFSMKSGTEHLKDLSDFIYSRLGPEFKDKALTDEVVIAVDEAATNIIIHAYQKDPSGDIRTEFTLDDGLLRIVLSHNGKPFDPAVIPKPDFTRALAKRKMNGMGMYIIRHFMDKVEYRFKDSKDPENHIIMEKKLTVQ